ncbi:putative P450 monooxygenase [Teratosphaeria nubilosa]|uniref:Putative P450 monooxygenase n=1 Tax=Teratosphaeria nubilosa TaxID=161662 RepID=A0A6G1LD65_9PEZI|nr:putative P450 monooxygenase [Teratosphaeria nubilosa]
MLVNFIDRVWTPVLLCAGITFTIHAAQHALPPLVQYGLAAVNFVYLAHCLVTAAVSERKIDRLGKRAPTYRTATPWNLGMLWEGVYYALTHRNHEFWWKAFKSANPNIPYTVEVVPLGMRMIFTADEENTKAILATQFQDYGKGPQFRKEWMDFLGHSIFTTDGELWHNSRSLLRPQFIKDRVSDLHTFETHVQALLPMLAGTHSDATVRVDDLFHRFTLDAATDFLLGKSVDSLQNGQTEFAQAFAEVQRVQSIIARTGPLNHLVPRKSFFRGLEVLNEFVNTYVDRTLQLSPEELEKVGKSDENYTFLHALASYTRDRTVLRDQLVAVLLAGRDTTAVTLSWLFYELARHPQVVKKLREEVLNTVGPTQVPTYENLKQMRYLQHCLNEGLRLYPVVPYNVRVALKDTTLPRGGGPNGDEPIGILEGTPIAYSTLILQRRADIYPAPSTGFPDHLDFVPERWDSWTPKSWTYIPFNGGPRICIGQQFALTEMAYTAVRIFQTYERVELRDQDFPMLKTDIVLAPAHGVRVAFFRDEKE